MSDYDCRAFLKGAKDEVYFEFESEDYDITYDTKEDAEEWALAEIEDLLLYGDSPGGISFAGGFAEYEKYKDTIDDPSNWKAECSEIVWKREYTCKVEFKGDWEVNLGKEGHLLKLDEAWELARKKFNEVKAEYPLESVEVGISCDYKKIKDYK